MRATNTLTAGLDRALYIGELPATGWHRHASPVLLLGLSGRFSVHLEGGKIEQCRSALVDAGVEHVFDPTGECVALIYLEPDAPEALCLRAAFARHGGVIFDPAIRAASRSRFDRYLHEFDLASLLRLPPAETKACALDARVQRSLQALRRQRAEPAGREEMAAGAGLSASRFNHLFREEMGVSFRDYRLWTQVRMAMISFRPDGSLTDAALAGAFSDSSHFSRIFRQTFGMTPSSVLKPLKEISLLR